MAGRLGEDSCTMNHTATLWIFSPKAKLLDPGDRDRSGAHRAGLERDPDRALVQARGTELRSGPSNGLDFSVGRRVRRDAHGVTALRDHLAAKRHDRADRDFARLGRLACEIERPAHRRRKGKSHRSPLADRSAKVS